MPPLQFPGLLGSLVAAMLFGLYFLPPGFLFAAGTNLFDFNQRSGPEKLVWSACVSAPLSTVAAVILGHWLSFSVINGVFLAIALGAVALLLRRALRRTRSAGARAPLAVDRELWRLVAAVGAMLLYIIAAMVMVRSGTHVYEGAFSSDWGIRAPLQYAAGLGGVPPINPFFTMHGHNVPLRYYYFFFVLCGLPMRLAGLPQRAALVGGTLWAGVIFLGVAWLLLKYLAIPAADDPFASAEGKKVRLRPRRQALLLMLLAGVMGLDIVPTLTELFLYGTLQPIEDWWHSARSTTFYSGLPLAPHHVLGLACALLAYLLIVFTTRSEVSRRRAALHSVLAGVCFAATVGMSTYVALVFAIVGSLLAIDAARRREWRIVLSALGAGAVGGILDLWYILETLRSQSLPVAAGSATGKHMLKLVARGWHRATGFTWSQIFPRLHLPVAPHAFRYIYALPALGLLWFIEFGALWFVLWYRFRMDFGSRKPLGREARALWCLFLGAAGMAFFVSSEPLQGTNDLGSHAGGVVRLVLVLWACPLAAEAWRRYRSGARLPRRTRLALRVAAVCAALGVAGQAWDLVVQRIYVPLVDRGVIRPQQPFVEGRGVSLRYAELQDAWQVIGREEPAEAVVQSNPDTPLQNVVRLYMDRRMAAGDVACETAFGGNTAECVSQLSRPLLSLYAQTDARPVFQVTPDGSAAAFARVCSSLGLTALIALEDDPVWKQAGSWVWHEPVLYAGRYVRVLACPARDGGKPSL